MEVLAGFYALFLHKRLLNVRRPLDRRIEHQVNKLDHGTKQDRIQVKPVEG